MNKRIKAGRIVFSAILVLVFLNTVFLSWLGTAENFREWITGIERLLPLIVELGAGIIGTSWIRSIVPKPLHVAKVEIKEGS